MPDYFKQVGIAVGLLNIVTMLVGFYTAKLGKLSLPQSIAIALESGLQNGTLGIVIAISILLNAEMSIPAAVYSLIMFGTGGFMVWRFGRTKESTTN
jgi:BASS family bile acid:Na+ symporter